MTQTNYVDTLDPEYKTKQLEILRRKIEDDNTLKAPTDDQFLSRFLRAKAYHVNSAFIMLKGYIAYNEKYTDSWLHIERVTIKQVLGTEIIDILPGCDARGRRIFWFRFGKVNPREFKYESGLHIAALVGQIALTQSIPFNSIQCIYDFKDTTFSHVKSVTPSFAKQMVSFLTYCIPCHVEQIHIIREASIFGMLFSIFKVFLTENVKKRIVMHGNNLNSLHEYIDKKLLPVELGGEAPYSEPLRWNDELQKESVLKEIEKSGYVISN